MKASQAGNNLSALKYHPCNAFLFTYRFCSFKTCISCILWPPITNTAMYNGYSRLLLSRITMSLSRKITGLGISTVIFTYFVDYEMDQRPHGNFSLAVISVARLGTHEPQNVSLRCSTALFTTVPPSSGRLFTSTRYKEHETYCRVLVKQVLSDRTSKIPNVIGGHCCIRYTLWTSLILSLSLGSAPTHYAVPQAPYSTQVDDIVLWSLISARI